LGGGDRPKQLLDAGGERAELGGERVDLVQQHPGQFGVVVVETAGQRLDQGGVLGPHLAAGQAGQHLGVAFAGDQRCEHVPHRGRLQRAGHAGDLDQRVLQ
jgi:hypothetical protein